MRNRLWGLLKAILFRLDAEKVHRFSVTCLRLASKLGPWFVRLISGAGAASRVSIGSSSREAAPRVWNLEFSSRLGLAAGFDKDAEILAALPALGFGFAEIGTVTPRPQAGNDRPRLFRAPERSAIFNRMGFNGLGATLVAERVARVRPGLPRDFRVGINVGKNKDTPNEQAAADYLRAARAFEGLADYLVVNVSSPNTPGLRALQTSEALRPILEPLNELITGWKVRPPLLLKLAPELGGDDLGAILKAGPGWGVDGWVLTNTLAGAWKSSGSNVAGGWSGGPLTELSRRRLAEARQMSSLPIISVGGILTAEEAQLRLTMGADLVQVYTGWVFGGPGFPAQVARAITGA